MKQDYTLFTRETGNNTVYYYYVYDENGKRHKFSTGQTTKAAAVNYCNTMLKQGKLLPKVEKEILFKDFAKDFWDYDKSVYIRRRLARGGSFTQSFALSRLQSTNKHIIPYFGDMKLDTIRPKYVEDWLLGFIDKGYAPQTANQNLLTLRIMLDEAVRQEYIPVNPCDKVERLCKRTRERGILTLHEVKELLHPDNYNKYWDNPYAYAGNFTAALTGLREGEVRALRAEDIHSDYILVSHSYDLKFGLKDTKTHKTREVPIPDMLYKLLQQLGQGHPGYIFSYDGGKTPLNVSMLRSLYRALERLGISEQQRKERNICFHSWRHFFNTTLRAGNISDSKTQAITGHSTLEMTEHYTHFTHEDLKEVNRIQIGIIEGVGA